MPPLTSFEWTTLVLVSGFSFPTKSMILTTNGFFSAFAIVREFAMQAMLGLRSTIGVGARVQSDDRI